MRKLVLTVLLLTLAALVVARFSHAATRGSGKTSINIEYVPNPSGNGDYRLFIFSSNRLLVCEEQPIKIVEQGDAVNPIVLECKHK